MSPYIRPSNWQAFWSTQGPLAATSATRKCLRTHGMSRSAGKHVLLWQLSVCPGLSMPTVRGLRTLQCY